jgi:uncharacterized protein (TIGR02611 family)
MPQVSQVHVQTPIEPQRRPNWFKRVLRAIYRFLVAVVGGAVLAVGVVLIPYPGPGWFIVFGGLAILATEFTWAKRLLTFLRRRYDAWRAWLRRRHWTIRLFVYLLGAALIVATLWVLGAIALAGGWINVHWPWLRSPVFG